MFQGSTFRECLIEDLKQWKIDVHAQTPWWKLWKHTIYACTMYHGFNCIFWYRVNRSMLRYSRLLARILSVRRYYLFANDISFLADIGPGCKINHTSDIVIGAGAVIGRNARIYNGVTIGAKHFDRPDEKPHIGNDVTIGTGAKILGSISVGDMVTIGALTLCTKSVESGCIVVGNPMRILQKESINEDKS